MRPQIVRNSLRLSAQARVWKPAVFSRACSQCRSAREWKENHGAWSRTPVLRPGSSTTAISPPQSHLQSQLRSYASEGRSPADQVIEEITELFNTAKDEFDLAYEGTEQKTIYAAEDRAAAEEEFGKLKEAYELVFEELPAEVSEEVQKRVGHRIRELEQGMKRLNELAMEDH